jgi:hypothetical protein
MINRALTRACVLGVFSRKPVGGVVRGAAVARADSKSAVAAAINQGPLGHKQSIGIPSFSIVNEDRSTPSERSRGSERASL